MVDVAVPLLFCSTSKTALEKKVRFLHYAQEVQFLRWDFGPIFRVVTPCGRTFSEEQHAQGGGAVLLDLDLPSKVCEHCAATRNRWSDGYEVKASTPHLRRYLPVSGVVERRARWTVEMIDLQVTWEREGTLLWRETGNPNPDAEKVAGLTKALRRWSPEGLGVDTSQHPGVWLTAGLELADWEG